MKTIAATRKRTAFLCPITTKRGKSSCVGFIDPHALKPTKPLHSGARYDAYGRNAGGVKNFDLGTISKHQCLRLGIMRLKDRHLASYAVTIESHFPQDYTVHSLGRTTLAPRYSSRTRSRKKRGVAPMAWTTVTTWSFPVMLVNPDRPTHEAALARSVVVCTS